MTIAVDLGRKATKQTRGGPEPMDQRMFLNISWDADQASLFIILHYFICLLLCINLSVIIFA